MALLFYLLIKFIGATLVKCCCLNISMLINATEVTFYRKTLMPYFSQTKCNLRGCRLVLHLKNTLAKFYLLKTVTFSQVVLAWTKSCHLEVRFRSPVELDVPLPFVLALSCLPANSNMKPTKYFSSRDSHCWVGLGRVSSHSL